METFISTVAGALVVSALAGLTACAFTRHGLYTILAIIVSCGCLSVLIFIFGWNFGVRAAVSEAGSQMANVNFWDKATGVREAVEFPNMLVFSLMGTLGYLYGLFHIGALFASPPKGGDKPEK